MSDVDVLGAKRQGCPHPTRRNKPKSVIRISHCHTTLRNPNDRFGFIMHRNPKAIRQMQQKVVDYEQALQMQAELLLQQKRITEEQGELKKHLKK